MDILPHELTALRRATEACIAAEKPITAEILTGLLERAGGQYRDLRLKLNAMPRDEK